jgi:hypothetical protein
VPAQVQEAPFIIQWFCSTIHIYAVKISHCGSHLKQIGKHCLNTKINILECGFQIPPSQLTLLFNIFIHKIGGTFNTSIEGGR